MRNWPSARRLVSPNACRTPCSGTSRPWYRSRLNRPRARHPQAKADDHGLPPHSNELRPSLMDTHGRKPAVFTTVGGLPKSQSSKARGASAAICRFRLPVCRARVFMGGRGK